MTVLPPAPSGGRAGRRWTGSLLTLLFALLLTGLTTYALFAVQAALSAREGLLTIRPYGIVYIVPVAVLTAAFGYRYGVVALGSALAFSAYFLMEPRNSFAVAYTRDRVELVFVLLVGGLVILAVESMRRNAALMAEARAAVVRQRNFLREVLDSVTDSRLRLCDHGDDLPPPLEAFGDTVTLSPDNIAGLRRQAGEAARRLSFSEPAVQDLMTAVGEASLNAVVHAGGGQGRVCADVSAGRVQVWVQDHGRGIAEEHLHQATLRRGFSTAGTLGHGFSLMLHTAERLWLLTGTTGTTVVLEQSRLP